MRQPNNRRPRNRSGGGNRRSNQPTRNTVFDSNGPDVRVRGSASQVHEKYMTLARDAQAAGQHIKAEGYLQHAEHYLRILNQVKAEKEAAAERQEQRQEQRREERAPREAQASQEGEDNGDGNPRRRARNTRRSNEAVDPASAPQPDASSPQPTPEDMAMELGDLGMDPSESDQPVLAEATVEVIGATENASEASDDEQAAA